MCALERFAKGQTLSEFVQSGENQTVERRRKLTFLSMQIVGSSHPKRIKHSSNSDSHPGDPSRGEEREETEQ